MYFGVDYYPEHWPHRRWEEDARLMHDAGFNVARLGEFAWALLEPEEGVYNWAWLDRAIAVLAKKGIKTVLGTPTAAPPAWLCTRYPEIMRVTHDGRRVTFGMRRQYCATSSVYRDHTRRIVTALAEHYAGHPDIVAWQLDNEFGCHDSTRCYCPECKRAFAEWLRARYGSLDALNDAWGASFWSHVYTDWDQIPLPWASSATSNPCLELDYDRFASDQMVAYQQIQIDILREKDPEHLITTNFMGFAFHTLDYHDLARPLDFVAWDNYPLFGDLDPVRVGLSHDTMRGLRQEPFWVMEEQAGPAGQRFMGRTPRPGQLRLWTYQAIAHGADGVVYFRWRTCRFNAEEYWHGILEHHGRPGRRYQEIADTGRELIRIGDQIKGASSPKAAAILHSYDDRWALTIQPAAPGLEFGEIVTAYYRALRVRHIPVDVLSPVADLSPYPLVIAPSLHILSPDLANRLEQYVRYGGTLVLGTRTGVKDESNRVVDLPLPGLVADLCGAEVEEYDALGRGTVVGLEFAETLGASAHRTYAADTWADVLIPRSTDTRLVARYADGPYSGRPAITVRPLGHGRVYYVGTVCDDDALLSLSDLWTKEAGIEPPLRTPAGVEVAVRTRDDCPLYFLMNHDDSARTVSLSGDYVDLLSAKHCSGSLELAPFGVAILRPDQD